MSRILLYCKDVQLLTGKSESGARRLIAKIKARFNRQPAHYVTIYDFCEFHETRLETVTEKLKI